METLQARERETYEEMHCVSGYTEFSPGERFLPAFLDMANIPLSAFDAEQPPTVLDAGCSSGKASLELMKCGFDVTMCDLTDAGLVEDARRLLPFFRQSLWDSMRFRDKIPEHCPKAHGIKWDWVYCCDVLEHIPPEFTMLVITRLLEAATKGVFLSIALQADNFGAWVGKPLHQTVQSYQWWFDRLAELGEIVEARDLLTNGLYLVRAKP